MNRIFSRYKPGIKRLLNRTGTFALVSALILCAGSSAMAIQPGKWEQGSEPDFQAGKRDQTVVSSLGEVELSSRTKKLADLPLDFNAVYDAAVMPNGDVYLAAGAEKSEIFKWSGGKLTPVLSLQNEQVFALTVDGAGRLLVAVSAEEATRVGVLENGKLTTLVPLDGIRYVWDMTLVGDRLALATGTPGRILLVDLKKADGKPLPKPAKDAEPKADTKPAAKAEKADGEEAASEEAPDPTFHASVTQVLKSKQNNLLCLGVGPNMSLYAGSDTEGLVYRVLLKKDYTADQPMVIFDAPEPEIGALLVQPDGTVFVGTADVSMADSMTGGAMPQAGLGAASKAGHPGSAGAGGGQGPEDGIGGEGDGESAMPGLKKEKKAPAPAKESKDSESRLPMGALAVPAAAGIRTPVKLEAQAAGAEPVASQDLDRLRAVIKQKMEMNKKVGASGEPSDAAIGPAGARRARPAGAAVRPGAVPDPFVPGSMAGPGGANAVYRITPDGFVHEAFRDNAMILRIVQQPDGKLLVGTGNNGVLYRLDIGAGEYTALADLEAEQIGTVLQLPSGQTLLATSNPAQVLELDKGYAKSGTLTSSVFDASQISLWGNLAVQYQAPKGTKVSIQTRSGNVEDPENGPWSVWSEAQVLTPGADAPAGAPSFAQIQSPPARFLQYKVTLEGTPDATPVVQKVDATYVVPNLRPKIASIRVTHPDDQPMGGPAMNHRMPAMPKQVQGGNRPGRPNPNMIMVPGQPGEQPEPTGNPALTVEWEAVDPNNDRMIFKIEYRAVGTNVWLPVTKEPVENGPYEWQSLKVPDGRYQARLTASDSPDNPADMALSAQRVSSIFVVDNTPPVIEGVKFKQDGQAVTLTGQVKDAVSTIRSIHYTVDGAAEWKMVVPDDMLFDSTKESFTIKIVGLSPGEHVVSVRAVDARGNPKYASTSIQVK